MKEVRDQGKLVLPGEGGMEFHDLYFNMVLMSPQQVPFLNNHLDPQEGQICSTLYQKNTETQTLTFPATIHSIPYPGLTIKTTFLFFPKRFKAGLIKMTVTNSVMGKTRLAQWAH